MTRLGPVLVAGLVLGCRAGEPVAIPVYADSPRPHTPSASSGNAFDGYMLAGRRAVELSPEDAARVSFGPGLRAQARERLRPALDALEAASRLPCRYRFWARTSPEPHDYEVGLRSLSRALAWTLEQAVTKGDDKAAVRWALVAHRVGFDLLGGDAVSATLGTAFLDESRAAIAPRLAAMPPAELRRLWVGLTRVLETARDIEGALQNEQANMAMGVETVAAHYRRGTLDALVAELGRGIRPAVGYLKGLDGREALDFFDRFRQEAAARAAHIVRCASLPTRDRTEFVPAAEERPWKRFAAHYFSGPEVILSLRDRATARTRLLAVTAWAQEAVAEGGRAPASLERLGGALCTDPYTGEPLRYAAAGSEFKVYAVGADGRDDGGTSDDSGLEPDVVLEGAW